jgi:LysR family transcriptional regulator of gallate degradation
MDPRKLLYLASIIEHGSFKKAAKHLHISQPALSTSMDRLEKSLGGKLLERGPAGIAPTLLGELLYSHARLIREEIDLAETRIQRLNDSGERILTMGTLPSLASNVIPTALRRWRVTHLSQPVRVVEKVQVELLISLMRGELEFFVGLAECYDFLDGLKQRVLFRDRLYVMGRPEHPVFRMKAITWADLAQFPWVLPMVGRQRTILEKLMNAGGVDLPRQLTECGSIDFTRSLVAESDHLALLPAHAAGSDVREGRIKLLSLTVPQMNREIAVIFRERSPLDTVSRELIAHIEVVGGELGPGLSRAHAASSGTGSTRTIPGQTVIKRLTAV